MPKVQLKVPAIQARAGRSQAYTLNRVPTHLESSGGRQLSTLVKNNVKNKANTKGNIKFASSSRLVRRDARSANELILNSRMYPVAYISSKTTVAMEKMTTPSTSDSSDFRPGSL